MNILAITALYPPFVMGGAEQSAASLAEGLQLRGHNVNVLTLGPPSSEALTYELNGVSVHRIPLKNIYWPYTAPETEKPNASWKRLAWHVKDSNNQDMVKDVMKKVMQLKPELVMTHNLQGFSTAIWPALAQQKFPILHTIHDFALLCPRTVLFKNGKNCGLQNDRCLDCKLLTQSRHRHTHSVNAAVGVSQAVLAMHQSHQLFTQVPTQAILNAVKTNIEPKLRVRDTQDTRLSFGFLGRVDTPKGFNTLLEALAHFPKDKVRLVVAGKVEEDYMQSLQEQYDLSNVVFLGYCPPQQLFNQIDVLVFPSYAMEALGNGVYESYFQGLPVIGSDKGGIPEMINENRTGFVFPAGDVAALREALTRFIEDPNLANRMAPATLSKALDFMPKRRIDAYEDMLERTLVQAKIAS